jgi:hypothetical protein
MPSLLRHPREYLRRRRAARAESKIERQKHVEKLDQERKTSSLLRIALERPSSLHSLTASDPTQFYRSGKNGDDWMKHEAGGTRLFRWSGAY